MQPLDLRIVPPRPPREQLAGLLFLPRVIDKLRATLPGGDVGVYFAYKGLSALFAHLTKIDLHELRDVIASAGCEADVEAWVAQRVTPEIVSKTNHVLSTYTQEKMPPEWHAVLATLAPAHLRAQYPNLFDLLEADDRLSFQGVVDG